MQEPRRPGTKQREDRRSCEQGGQHCWTESGLGEPLCTLIAIHRAVPGRWLVVAANRDEFFDRPSEGPAIRSSAEIPHLAPRDIRAGGTWLGLNKEGVFSALTNLSDPNPDKTRKSRGAVVTDSLRHSSAKEAASELIEIENGVYNPFNAFIADRENAYLVVYREVPVLMELEPGIHVVGNTDPRDSKPGKAVPGKIGRARAEAARIAGRAPSEVVNALGTLCGSHGEEPASLNDLCVHMGDSYGTRSSILLELTESFFNQRNRRKGDAEVLANHAGSGGYESPGRFLYAAGAPCTTPFEDVSPLLEELRHAPSYAPSEIS